MEELELRIRLYRALIESDDLPSAVTAALRIVCQFAGWDLGVAWLPAPEETELRLFAAWHQENPSLAEFVSACQGCSFPRYVGMPGRIWMLREHEWTTNLAGEPTELFPLAPFAAQAGIRAVFGVPVLHGDRALAVLLFCVFETKEKDVRLIEVVSSVSAQLGFALHHKHANEMLQKNEGVLREAREELEVRVQERTLELAGANQDLKNEIAERKRIEEELQARVRQQAAVVQLGQCALGLDELPVLMDEACVVVAENLDVEYCKVLELLPDGNSLLLRAGFGWKEGLVGQEKVSAGTHSQAGYTLLSNQPVIVEDLRTETRFIAPSLLREHGVMSGMSVIIPGRDRPFGVLGAHTVKRRTFNKDDIHFLESVAYVLSEAIERKRTEQVLRESEEQVRLTLQFNQAVMTNMGEGLYVVDTQGLVTYINRGAERLFGWSSAELMGRKMHDVTHYQHADGTPFPADECPGLQVLQKGVVLADHDDVFIRKDGTLFPVIYSAAPIRSDGTTVGLVVVFRDVTARKRGQQDLERSTSWLQNLIATTQDAVISIDRKGRVVLFNPAAERIFGYTKAEIQGQKVTVLMAEPYATEHDQYVARYEAGGEPRAIGRIRTVEARRRNGEIFPIELSVTQVTSGESDEVHYAAFIRDISEFRRGQRWLQSLIDTTQDAVLAIDRQGRVVLFNPAAEQIFGYTREEIIGQKVNVLMGEPYQSEHDSYIERYERTGVAHAIGRIRTVTAKRKSGELFPIELSVTKVAEDADVQYAAFIRDISEKAKLQDQLMERERLATIGTTAAKIGHELANPLNGMSLTIQLLE